MADIFRIQQRLDDFRAALGSFGAGLDRTAELDELLDAAERNGWTAERIGQYIAGRLPRKAKSGLVILSLRTIAAAPEPASPSDHALDAVRRSRQPFRQPLPPCGQCDGSPARWLAVTPSYRYSIGEVVHCPTCWTAPPGYLAPAARRVST